MKKFINECTVTINYFVTFDDVRPIIKFIEVYNFRYKIDRADWICEDGVNLLEIKYHLTNPIVINENDDEKKIMDEFISDCFTFQQEIAETINTSLDDRVFSFEENDINFMITCSR